MLFYDRVKSFVNGHFSFLLFTHAEGKVRAQKPARNGVVFSSTIYTNINLCHNYANATCIFH